MAGNKNFVVKNGLEVNTKLILADATNQKVGIGSTAPKYELDLLENGPKSLSQSWMMGALHNKWKKMKGYKDPEPPDCSSSMQEWEQSIKKYQ